MQSTPVARRRLPRAARMEQTLSVAHVLFAERGYGAVTMEEVAAAVGVTKPLLYNYFGNKEELYRACMEPAGKALVSAVMAAIEATSTPQEALRSGIQAFFAFVDEDRGAWRVLFDETVPTEGRIARRVGEFRMGLTELVARTLLEQLPPRLRRRAKSDVEGLSNALMGAAEGLARWWLRTEAVSAREAAEMLISTVEPGLRARVEAATASSTPSSTPGSNVGSITAAGSAP